MNKELSIEQRIHNAYGSEEIERIHAIHQYTVSTGRYREEWVKLWDTSDKATWGFNWGRCVGWREIWHDNVTYIQASQLQPHEFSFPYTYPEGGGREYFTTAYSGINHLNSGVVEVAEDGNSGRASWVANGPGIIMLDPDDVKKWGINSPEHYGADFIYDEKSGHWKYFHEQAIHDISNPFDCSNWAYDQYKMYSDLIPAPGEEGWDTARIPEIGAGYREGPPRSDTTQVYKNFNTLQSPQEVCAPPKPYKTLDDDNTYAPLNPVINRDLFKFNEEKSIWECSWKMQRTWEHVIPEYFACVFPIEEE